MEQDCVKDGHDLLIKSVALLTETVGAEDSSVQWWQQELGDLEDEFGIGSPAKGKANDGASNSSPG